jgi:flagellar biosynthesis/type III secretory pathway chaperone
MDEALSAMTTLDGLLEQDFGHIQELRMNELYENNERKENLEARLRQLEERWKELSDGLGRELGIPRSSPTIKEMAGRLDSPWGEALIERRDRLSVAATVLRTKGQANIDLLKHSLLRVSESLNLINHFTNPGAVYGSGGKLDPPGSSGSFLSSLA